MSKIIVRGGNKLHGEVKISSAKNAVLPIMAACILSSDKCIIDDVPLLEDVFVISNILKSIGAEINIDKNSNKIVIDSSNIRDSMPDSELVKKMRASFLIMGPMISRFGHFKLSLPGGCNIGTRPIDLHLKGFNALRANIDVGHGYVEASVDKLIGNNIYLDFPSVGATENIMMAAVMAEGETIIENAAEEPEIADLGKFLNNMGASIIGAGSDTIRIIGVKELKGTTHNPINDRIECGTFMVAAAITRSKFKINRVNLEYLKPIIAKLTEAGVYIKPHGNSVIVDGNRDLKPIDVKTMPYPGFPTDMQSQITGLLATVTGTSIVTETIFENRFMHAAEMKRMGANIKIDGRSAVIEGVPRLTGAEVRATDLRAGAALILCGLAAEGETEISDIYHVDRGYVSIENKFKALGADIARVVN
ncbi:UDP-N-acetylglucosamine 1-carboxyvinyltransferase [Clostridium tyrobutyricum]|uniref:UDP-N-acetylglucosamine 1-carboxyvinyltransferase n=1 Tax=Clostridium tyrobutyricum DIVETGP TaxID=1408889 RepID=W6NGB4_CLOTY|nr:UDP-N-acetylglucosamine 1-carboxyvinyltransferase [Clostridium tyrobutyricum]AND83426.1 UDP-N-acetylglucosamine 1-carboxyvinyltransferase [Clostridium tyrobutyricum]ANP68225.1 UDP-N-acetylglucosamine 1-carboxyvinyltransferase [Clostridium tyrobutyricum]MBV4433263.1 UDP-N-acetylglucosamine 1-carboxyvinyltransferase [Clostridium tyrobutyricum]QNB67429.1 UDP-N-acetylglucosamine 1-carboxyvinyltransferase [Clostridium tyrobutyricum]CDL91082.1 UDP-N-acetylglucosamine 1-carboxyvinyltransferase [Cl